MRGGTGFPERVIARMYSVGMEEEYFVFDAKTRRAVRRIDKKFFSLARENSATA